MEDERLRGIVESLLFAAGEPVSLTRIVNALDDVPREQIKQALAQLGAELSGSARGVNLEEIAGGYQLRTPKENAEHVRRLLASKPPRLSRPLLETLAIIAYRPEVTRPEIEHLRGVDSGGVIDTLIERELIRVAGRKEVPGRPLVYETTPGFLELFGLASLDALPELEEFRAIEGALAEPASAVQANSEEISGAPTSPKFPDEADGGKQDQASAEPESERIEPKAEPE